MDYWSSCVSVDDEFEKLVLRLNPPRVAVDNALNKKATLIKVSVAPGGRQRRFKTYSDFCLRDDMPLRHILHS